MKDWNLSNSRSRKRIVSAAASFTPRQLKSKIQKLDSASYDRFELQFCPILVEVKSLISGAHQFSGHRLTWRDGFPRELLVCQVIPKFVESPHPRYPPKLNHQPNRAIEC